MCRSPSLDRMQLMWFPLGSSRYQELRDCVGVRNRHAQVARDGLDRLVVLDAAAISPSRRSGALLDVVAGRPLYVMTLAPKHKEGAKDGLVSSFTPSSCL